MDTAEASKAAVEQRTFGDLSLHDHRATCREASIPFSPMELEVLRCFFRNLSEERQVTRRALFEHMYGVSKILSEQDVRRIDVYLAKVRRKLKDSKSNCIIKRMGPGYKLVLKPSSM